MKIAPRIPVVVSGIGETCFFRGGRVPGTPKSAKQLAIEAAHAACRDAGIEPGAIDGILLPVRSAINVEDYINALGIADLKVHAEVKIGGASPCAAVSLAAHLVGAGAATRILIPYAQDSNGGGRLSGGGGLSLDLPGAQRRVHLEHPAGFTVPMQWYSLHANRWLYETGADPAGMRSVALSMRAHAQANEKATMHGRLLSGKMYDEAPYLVKPFRLYDVCLESDGGVALIVEAAATDLSSRKRKAYIAGGAEGHPDRPDDLVSRPSVLNMGIAKAAKRAFPSLGISLSDIDFAELYDCFTFIVLRQLEELGFCERGQSPEWVARTGIGPGGGFPINTHGGLLSCVHLAGIAHISEAVKQLRGEAGARQLSKASVGLVTGYGDFGDGSLLVLYN